MELSKYRLVKVILTLALSLILKSIKDTLSNESRMEIEDSISSRDMDLYNHHSPKHLVRSLKEIIKDLINK